MRLALVNNLSLKRRGAAVASFTPASLFAGGEAGAWYDPSDLSSMSQGSDGTTAAVVGQPVGRIMDKSGRGNHAVQATTSRKPILRQDASSKYYLEFDGVDDFMQVLFTIAQPWDRISALQQISWTSNDKPFGGGNANAGVLIQSGTTPNLRLNNGTLGPTVAPAIGSNQVITERHNGASSQLALGTSAYVTADSGTGVPGGITLSAPNDTLTWGENANVRLYGVAMIGRALTAPEITDLRTYMAGKGGVAL